MYRLTKNKKTPNQQPSIEADLSPNTSTILCSLTWQLWQELHSFMVYMLLPKRKTNQRDINKPSRNEEDKDNIMQLKKKQGRGSLKRERERGAVLTGWGKWEIEEWGCCARVLLKKKRFIMLRLSWQKKKSLDWKKNYKINFLVKLSSLSQSPIT